MDEFEERQIQAQQEQDRINLGISKLSPADRQRIIDALSEPFTAGRDITEQTREERYSGIHAIMKDEVSRDAIMAADEIIDEMRKHGLDYSVYRVQIAKELYDDGVWNGNWDSVAHFGDMQPLRLIQEDEYDQSMSDDEKPEWDDIIAQVQGGYLFLA